jgi:hypothetical protein
VTDHVRPDPKYLTCSEEEDQEYYNYVQSLKKYNDTSDSKKLMSFTTPSTKYPRGSFMQ